MAEIQAEFNLIDKVSSKLETITKNLQNVYQNFNQLNQKLKDTNHIESQVSQKTLMLASSFDILSQSLIQFIGAYFGLQQIHNLMQKSDDFTNMQNFVQTLQNTYETSDDIMSKIQQLALNTNKSIEEVAHGIHQFAFVGKEIFGGNLNSVLQVYRNVDNMLKMIGANGIVSQSVYYELSEIFESQQITLQQFDSINRHLGYFTHWLAKEKGFANVSALRDAIKDHKITAQDIVNGLQDIGANLDQQTATLQRTFKDINQKFKTKIEIASTDFYKSFNKLANLPIIDSVINRISQGFSLIFQLATNLVNVLYKIGLFLSDHLTIFNILFDIIGGGLLLNITRFFIFQNVLSKSVSLLKNIMNVFLGFNKTTFIIMAIVAGLEILTGILNKAFDLQLNIFSLVGAIFTGLIETFKWLFEILQGGLIRMYNIVISGINAMLVPLNKALQFLNKQPIELLQFKEKPEIRSFNEFKNDSMMKMAEIVDKINNDGLQKTIEDAIPIKDQLGLLNNTATDIKHSLFSIEDTILQDLIDVATNNALGLNGNNAIVNNITVNNDVDNINSIDTSTSQITEDSIINIIGKLFQKGIGI